MASHQAGNTDSKGTIHLQVQQHSGETLTSTADLRTYACCTASALPQHLKHVLADIHPEVSSRYYGCGLAMPDLVEGLRVLDLGCGAGRDVYVLSRLFEDRGSSRSFSDVPVEPASSGYC